MYTVDLNKTLEAARLALGALRQYAPDDTLRSINEILYALGQAQLLHGRPTTREGRGHTDITAREDLQAALALAYAALNIDTTTEDRSKRRHMIKLAAAFILWVLIAACCVLCAFQVNPLQIFQ